MSKLHIRLRELRNSRKLSQGKFAEQIGISKSSVNMYERGEREPGIDTLEMIADFFNVDLDYLTGKSNVIHNNTIYKFNKNEDNADAKNKEAFSSNEKQLVKKYRALDEHGKKMVDFTINEEFSRCTQSVEEETAPKPTLLIKHSIYKVSAGLGFDLGDGDSWEEIEIPDTRDTRRADFALTIKGDSMTPTFQDGDIVLVKQQDSIDVGQIGVFVLNGAGYIKKLGENRLISINDDYDDILLTEYDELFCAGKVIGRV